MCVYFVVSFDWLAPNVYPFVVCGISSKYWLTSAHISINSNSFSIIVGWDKRTNLYPLTVTPLSLSLYYLPFSFDATKSTKGASKLRRDLINSEIANLRDLLPLPSSTRQRLSQLQLMALVCVYVRKANYFQHGKCLIPRVIDQCVCVRARFMVNPRPCTRASITIQTYPCGRSLSYRWSTHWEMWPTDKSLTCLSICHIIQNIQRKMWIGGASWVLLRLGKVSNFA